MQIDFSRNHPVKCVFSTSGDVQYIGGCSVHRGVFSTSGGYREYIGGYHDACGGIFSTLGGTMSTSGIP